MTRDAMANTIERLVSDRDNGREWAAAGWAAWFDLKEHEFSYFETAEERAAFAKEGGWPSWLLPMVEKALSGLHA